MALPFVNGIEILSDQNIAILRSSIRLLSQVLFKVQWQRPHTYQIVIIKITHGNNEIHAQSTQAFYISNGCKKRPFRVMRKAWGQFNVQAHHNRTHTSTNT